MGIQNRRDFIRQLALTGSAVSLAASPWLSAFANNASPGKGPNDRVRLAVIGTGSRGSQLMRHLFELIDETNIELIALCDNFQLHLDQSAAMCHSKGLTPKTYTDYRELIAKEKPDAVLIATPLHEHAHITVDCLESGIHVFCEKAMARTLDETKRMYDTHRSTGRILQIGHQRLFNPVYIEGMQRIHDGELGTIGQIRAYWHRNNNWRRPLPGNNQQLERKINWRLYKEYSAGLLTELMSHQIQVANWALQKNPVSVMGTGSIRFWNDGREVDDNIALIYTYDDGTQFIYDSMTSNKKHGLEEQILGHKGTIEFETNRQFSEDAPKIPGIEQLINNIENSLFESLPIGGASWAPETASKYKGNSILSGTDFADTGLQLEAFIQFIRQGSAPEKIALEGYNSSIWTMLGEIAIETGKKLEMPAEFII
ncbi:Gfo/Idh/MocA family protein [Roseimarinus sediminis]|jgi:predicted dehydrogenase|uniref:Gfo/Idh/MocA family protein n=1 Tax=Roseimarinus sediminis TaxID=1610899 RepID=UPI003D22CAC0